MTKAILTVSDLKATVNEQEILRGIDFSINKGETVVLLGQNGAGKSTVAATIWGDPKFKVSGSVQFKGQEITGMKINERAKKGIFVSFQNPVEVPGVSTTEMLRTALEEKDGTHLALDEVREKINKAAQKLGQNIWFSERELNVGFSGGEKKKNEIMQMLVLEPELVILDEIDSGLDVDAAEKVSEILAAYQKESGCTYLIITHNMRILSHLRPSKTVLIDKGSVYRVGDEKLAKTIEKRGYKAIFDEISAEEGK